MSEDDVHEAAMCLRSARNRLAHEEDDLQGCSWQDLSSAFISAEALAAAARCRCRPAVLSAGPLGSD